MPRKKGKNLSELTKNEWYRKVEDLKAEILVLTNYVRKMECAVREEDIRDIVDENEELRAERSNLVGYIRRLEGVVRAYAKDGRNGEVNSIVKENIKLKRHLSEKEEKISQLVSNLLDSERYNDSLERKLKSAYDALDAAQRVFGPIRKEEEYKKRS